MAYWQYIPDDVKSRLAEIADLFVAGRDAFFETAERFHWTPGQASPAAQDHADLPSPDPAVTVPRGETGHRLIAEVVQISTHCVWRVLAATSGVRRARSGLLREPLTV